MTSSGVSAFNPSLSDIIAASLRKTGIINAIETPSAPQLINGRFALNAMLGEWSGTGIHVWATSEAILFLQKDQRRYQIGLASTDHMTDAYDFASTTLTAAAASGATALTVTSITDIAASDYLGIELDSGAFQWTTVNGAPSGTTVTATVALTGAAASGNRVIAYTSKIIRPLEIPNARYFNYSSLLENAAQRLSHIDYMEQPNKTSTASPFTQWRYQPKIPLGIVDVWLTPSDVKHAMRFTWHRPIYEFTSNSETADVPLPWINAIIYGLAAELIPDGDVPADRAEIIMKMATAKLQTAMAFDREPESILMQPDLSPSDHRISYGR